VYVFKSLEAKDLDTLLQRALTQDSELKKLNVKVLETEALFRFSGGDGRKLLNILELVVMNQISAKEIVVDNQVVTDTLQENIALYDKNGEQHYDIISAFIKSMRGSDPNGAIYWMARMLAGGEDPLFIARRMLILASEDVGLANPNAALLAQSCFDAVHQVGMPEARIILAETCIYLATSPKSNSAYMAIDSALAAVEKGTPLPVPLHLRNAPTSLMKELGYAKDYKYAHAYEGNFVEQEFLPEEIAGTRFYEPGDNAKEAPIRERMKRLWGDKYKY
jgi:putative ATPase